MSSRTRLVALDYGAIRTKSSLSLHRRCVELRQGVAEIISNWTLPRRSNRGPERSRLHDALGTFPRFQCVYESPREGHNPKINLHGYFAAIGVLASFTGFSSSDSAHVGASVWTKNYPTVRGDRKKLQRVALAADLFEIPRSVLGRSDASEWCDALLMADYLWRRPPEHPRGRNAIITFDPSLTCTGYAVCIIQETDPCS